MNFFAELKRRNVIRFAGLYLVGAWLLVQVASTMLPMFGASDWLPRSIRAGDDEQKMAPAFADYVADELRALGATDSEVADYEHADSSFMAVSAAIRYWRKHRREG